MKIAFIGLGAGAVGLMFVVRSWFLWSRRAAAPKNWRQWGERLGIHGAFGAVAVFALGVLLFGLVGIMNGQGS